MFVERLYRWLQPILLCLPPEIAHAVALHGLNGLYRLGCLSHRSSHQTLACEVMGLRFPNPVGLAAGWDKDGRFIEALWALGFGCVEVGTVTPRPQAGHPKPRIFRLVPEKALINRLGFNNQGLKALVARLKTIRHRQGILGVNLGKNSDTPLAQAANDYRLGLQAVYPYADYVTINVSSPNTEGLRQLQKQDALAELLTTLNKERQLLQDKYRKYVPIAVKMSPDMNEQALAQVADVLNAYAVDAMVATNTTLKRDHLDHRWVDQPGGLSGQPLRPWAKETLVKLKTLLDKRIALVAVGGILSAEDAWVRRQVGADLIQLSTGLVYRGPQLLQEVCSTLVLSESFDKSGLL